jgi:hypothetical protein
MEKALKEHLTDAKRAVKELSGEDLAKYADYHELMVKNFQHERAVHLAVTLFFAGALLLFFVMTVLFHLLVPLQESAGWFISVSLNLVVVILLVTTIFYIRHYYQLENGTQKLYRISQEIYARMK